MCRELLFMTDINGFLSHGQFDWITPLTFDAYSPKDIRIPTFFQPLRKIQQMFLLPRESFIDIYFGVFPYLLNRNAAQTILIHSSEHLL
jgi:hypothetical protein